MSPATLQHPKRRLRWWLVPLLVLGLMGMVGFCAVYSMAPAKGYDDSELMDGAWFINGRISSAQIRAQAGEERFWRAIKSSIQKRPADWETRFQGWLASTSGSQPSWLQDVIAKLRHPYDQRKSRLRAALMIIETDLKETATPVIPELVSLVESSRYEYAAVGIQSLAALGESASPALPVLFRRLERARLIGPDIVEAIGVIDPKGGQSTLQFISLLQKTSDQNRAAILVIIGRRARLQPELATNLWPVLQHTSRDVALAAVRGLAVAAQLTPDRLEPFRAGFRSTDARARWLSLNLVVPFGPGPDPASATNAGRFVPELRAAAARKSPDQPRALLGLRTVLAADVLPLELRRAAAGAMIASDSAGDAWDGLAWLNSPRGRFGTATNQMVSSVMEALGHPNERVRAKAVEMLGQLGPTARPALPRLRELSQDKWKMVRDAVELVLPKIGE